ncbi:MAG: TIGR01906 family membrane protein [Anaerolineales bacterium]|nr:TIGR01906 family membrane protein [Anaerolineales bacterium]
MHVTQDPPWLWALKALFQAILPLWLLLSSILLVLVTSPIWVPVEYRLPGFPQDSYGFSQAERIEWSAVDLAYLLNDADISYFDGYRLEDGTPMHNARELQHMDDVKNLIILVRIVWAGATVLLVLAAAVVWKQAGSSPVLASLRFGARATVILIAAIIVGVLISFRFIFIGFHRIFFEGDTWLFKYSDTFIRLYPERFWRDTFFYMGAAALLLAGLTWLAGKWCSRRVT